MKKILLVVLMVCLMCGCEKTIPTLEDGKEAVVTFEDGSMISANELYDKLKELYATSIIVDMIDTKILEKDYKEKIDEANEYASSYIESLKTYYVDENGVYDEQKLISAINQYYGYTSIEEYEKTLYLNYLRNLAIEDYAKSEVTDKEIKKYYKNEVVGDREISHIQIVPEVTDTMTDDEKKDAEDAALKEAKSIIAKLKKGEKFEDLAKEYSDDDATKDSGGTLGFINKNSFGSDAFDEEAFSLKVGSYSSTPVKTTNGYEIIYVTDEKEKEELDAVKDEIIETLAQENLSKDATIQVNAIKEFRKKHGVEIIDDNVKSSYNKYMNNLYDSALISNAQN